MIGLQKAETDQYRDIEEWSAGRGLVGSSYEGERRRGTFDDIQRQRMDQETQLQGFLATAETADRQAAGQYGLDTIRSQDVVGLERYRAELEGRQLEEAQRQFGGTLEISQQQIDLRAQELMQQSGQFGERLTFEEAQAEEAKGEA